MTKPTRLRAIKQVALLYIVGIIPGMLAAQPQTFRVEGRIIAPPGAEVMFQSGKATYKVITNDKYYYQADLPLGLYTMSARSPSHPLLQEFRRPIFEVTKPTTLVLNGSLSLGRPSCDPLWPDSPSGAPTPEQWQEITKDVCGGDDSFEVPSKDGVPFELDIRYLKRQRQQAAKQTNSYSGDEVAHGYVLPVIVEYNLFTLQADRVTYDTHTRTISAEGNVITVSPSGVEQQSRSLTVRIANGKAITVANNSEPR